jgi:hypothetical protein
VIRAPQPSQIATGVNCGIVLPSVECIRFSVTRGRVNGRRASLCVRVDGGANGFPDRQTLGRRDSRDERVVGSGDPDELPIDSGHAHM